ncbi:MAG: SEC-C domain-containing protein [Clostridiales bacterium]|jgi:hypothetical protein|nr:SEC-C domain-containing protein [Clostridiales bacterium]
MSLYESWKDAIYDAKGRIIKKHWDKYAPLERRLYEHVLEEKITELNGTVAELAEAHGMSAEYFCGFCDGISEALDNPPETAALDATLLEPDSEVRLKINFEKLYMKMVEFRAETLYTLKQWDNIFTMEERKEMYTRQKRSGTAVSGTKPGRNAPCPCGSGLKYKKCCGAAPYPPSADGTPSAV